MHSLSQAKVEQLPDGLVSQPHKPDVGRLYVCMENPSSSITLVVKESKAAQELKGHIQELRQTARKCMQSIPLRVLVRLVVGKDILNVVRDNYGDLAVFEEVQIGNQMPTGSLFPGGDE